MKVFIASIFLLSVLTVQAADYCFCFGHSDDGVSRPMDKDAVYGYKYEFRMDSYSPQGWVVTRPAQLIIPDVALYQKIRSRFKRNDPVCFSGERISSNYYKPQYLVRRLITPIPRLVDELSCGRPENIR